MIAAGLRDAVGETQAVLDHHAGALRHRLQRRMRGIARELGRITTPEEQDVLDDGGFAG
jgi:hypothetical protein